MTGYVWDVGFNFHAVPDPDNDNLPYLSNGNVGFPPNLTTNPDNKGIAAGPQFQVGDTLCFNGYNLTPGANPSDYKILSGSVIFRPFDDLTSFATPFNPPNPMTVGELPSNGSGISITLSPTAQVQAWWPIVYPGEIMHPGHFNFTFFLTVEGPNSKVMKFRADPEMFIDSAG